MYSFALATLAAVAAASYRGDVDRSYQPYGEDRSYGVASRDLSYGYGRRHQNLDLDDDKRSYASYGRRSDARREDSDLNTDKDGETYGHENGDHQHTEFGEKDNRNDDDLDARGYSGLTGGSRGSVRGVQANRDNYNNGYGERSYGYGDRSIGYGNRNQGYGYGDRTYGGYGDRSYGGYGDRTYGGYGRNYGGYGDDYNRDYGYGRGYGGQSYGRGYGAQSYGRGFGGYGGQSQW